MDKFYTMEIAGLTRNLPICPLNEKLSIAGFIMFSDVELTVKCAEDGWYRIIVGGIILVMLLAGENLTIA